MSNTATKTVSIVNELGMHARPAMLFVESASKFNASVTVRRIDQSESFDGKSIMQVMMLAATKGTKIEISASGTDADEAVCELSRLVAARFHED